ncbi:MAG: alpha-ketoglutarate-dependent dioxygenase AlkB [Pseudomonadota bacterium]
MSREPIQIAGFQLYKSWLDRPAQEAMVAEVREIARAAPFNRYVTPGGREMRVRMTSAGAYGWLSDRGGYRYTAEHPSGVAWPPIPQSILGVWAGVAPDARTPESCLVNYYDQQAKMSLHRDDTEGDFSQPVVSISLGDPALFRIGGLERGGRTQSVDLESGDVLVMGGAARLRYHGVDRIKFGGSTLLEKGGRLNLTLRVVTGSREVERKAL